MLKLKRPPQHSIDATAEWIHPSDSAWDHERIDRERDELAEQARANGGDETEALNKHPLAAWYRAENRFSLTAPLTIPERLRTGDNAVGTCTIEDYLTGKPTIWKIKPLGARAWRRLMSADRADWPVEAVKHGLVRIEQPDEEPIEPARDSKGGIIESWLDWLDSQDRSTLISLLGGGIFALTERGNGDEGKR
jgi:hypothetical protein